MRKSRRAMRGLSYAKRVSDINAIYDKYAKSGLTNREIWRRHVYPFYGVSERTFYNLLNASAKPSAQIPDNQLDLFSNGIN
jgi:hypothetical protein